MILFETISRCTLFDGYKRTKTSNETILLCKNNIETLGQLNQHKTVLQEQLKAESKSYTPKLKELRKEIQSYEKIKERALYLQQFELETQSRVEKGRSRL